MAAETSDELTADWDPVNPETMADYPLAHEAVRQQAPVAWSDRWGGFYTLMTYDDVVEASRDPARFTATKMTVIPSSPRKGLPRLPLQKDPPESDRYRKALNPFFKENRIQALAPRLRALSKDCWQTLDKTPHHSCFSADYVEPFTQGALCMLIGMDMSEAATLGQLIAHYVDAVQHEDLEKAGLLSRAVDQFAIDLVADRQKNPRDPIKDIVSGLIAAPPADGAFTAQELAGMVRLMLIGGHIVPRNFLCSVGWHMAMHPAHLNRLRTDPEIAKPMIEELLRYYASNQALVRVATQETEIGGQRIPEGCPVALNFLSANRDAQKFDDPMRFIPDRSPNRHLSFGIGPHMCLGVAMAKLQTRIVLDQLLGAPALAVAEEPKWARWTEYGVTELYLNLRPQS